MFIVIAWKRATKTPLVFP